MRLDAARIARLKDLYTRARSQPGYLLSRADRLVGFGRAAMLFRGATLGRRVCAHSYIRVAGARGMTLGSRITFGHGMIPSDLRCAKGAELVIGSDSGFNYGVSLDARRSIRIGERCMFASFVRISDGGANGAPPAPIVIEDNVWVAYGAILEPGVTVGRGSVVAAGSVVTRNVPPDSLAIGNPARCFTLGMVAKDAQASVAKDAQASGKGE